MVQVAKEIVRQALTTLGLPLFFLPVVIDQQALVRAAVVQLAQHPLDLARTDADPQMIAGDRFDRVRFVQDDGIVLGQQAAAGAPHGQIAEEQGVVDDQDLGVVDPAPSQEIEAIFVLRTVAPHAIAAVAGDFVPDLIDRLERKIAQRPVRRLLGPRADLAQLLKILVRCEQGAGTGQRRLQASQADVVAAAFDQHRAELARDHAVQQRQILVQQLLLQTYRVRGHDDPADGILVVLRVLFTDRQNRRDQVGKTLAHTRPRFGHQMMPAAQRRPNRLSHLQLLGAVFVVLQAGCDPAFRAQNRFGSQCHGSHDRQLAKHRPVPGRPFPACRFCNRRP